MFQVRRFPAPTAKLARGSLVPECPAILGVDGVAEFGVELCVPEPEGLEL